ncbi:MAG: hypothetical protein ACHQ2F_14580, partial [Desulfobaccales bacterium]
LMLIVMYFQLKSNFPKYALIDKAGKTIILKNFGEYGLYVEKNIIKTQDNDTYPIYIISFDKEPDYFEVSTNEGATHKIEHIGNKKYHLKFVGFGFGSPIIDCDFKIQAY